MLSNLCVKSVDDRLFDIAMEEKLTYTHYADDLTFSTTEPKLGRRKGAEIVGQIYRVLGAHGLSPNLGKTQIIHPGARKVVLGLLVDGSDPRLMRDYKSRIRRHLHYLRHPDYGPTAHADKRGFASVLSMHAHIRGLIGYAEHVEPAYGAARRAEFDSVEW